jgi:antitoxin component of RelBE/YafQ-DinJ toxin-antitoxin module
MARLIFELDDDLFEEVNEILDSVGLDLDIAFSIFARKIVKEKGLPFNVRQKHDDSTSESANSDNWVSPQLGLRRRSNNAITVEMIEEVWSAFIKIKDGYFDVKEMADHISEKTGMNYGSATIYLNILINLFNGEINKRSMKPSDFEFFIDKFKNNLGETAYQKALHSIEVSIPYWNKNIPTFANSMTNFLKKHIKMILNESGQKTFKNNTDKIDIANVLDRYEKYLESIGYSVVTPSGLPSTTSDYARRVSFVLQTESINIKELMINIDLYIKAYDYGGSKEYLGKKSNRAVINALKRFKEFLQHEGL